MIINTPLSEDMCLSLKAGDMVLITGKVFTARDQAHRKFSEMLNKGETLPFDTKGAIIYYTGPVFREQQITSAGPTTSRRMDSATPLLLSEGIKGIIGKGLRSPAVKDALIENRAV